MNYLTDEQILENDRKEKLKSEEMRKLENLSPEDSRALLKDLFKKIGVVSTWKWDDALRNVKTESQFRFVKLTIQEKK